MLKKTIENCWKKIKKTSELIDDINSIQQEQEKELEELTVNFSKLNKNEWFDQFAFTPNELYRMSITLS